MTVASLIKLITLSIGLLETVYKKLSIRNTGEIFLLAPVISNLKYATGRWSKKWLPLSIFRVENGHAQVGGQKRAKICHVVIE